MNNGVDTTDANITAIIFVIRPPKYGITVVSAASNPRSNQLGCPIILNSNVYSINWIQINIA